VEEVGLRARWIDERRPTQRVAATALVEIRDQTVKEGLARPHKDGCLALAGPLLVQRQPRPVLGRVTLQDGPQRVQRAGLQGAQGEKAVQVAVDADAQPAGDLLHDAAHLAGQQLAAAILVAVSPQAGQLLADLLPFAVQLLLCRFQGLDLLDRQLARHGLRRGVGTLFGQRLLHIGRQRRTFEEPAHHVKHLVVAQLIADGFQLVQQRL